MRTQPKLHVVMSIILLQQEGHAGTFEDLRHENRRLQLYRREDGKYPGANQMRARAGKYPEIFASDGKGRVKFVGNPAGILWKAPR